MKGYTLIELAVALSIMTILVAVMLPRFVQLQRAARIGNLKGLQGSVSIASTLIHATLQAQGGLRDTRACAGGGTADNQSTGPGTVCTPAGLVHALNGYAASTPLGTPGILAAAGIDKAFNPTDAQLKADGYRVSVAGGVTTFARADASEPGDCSFTYTQAPDARTAASISPPVTTGC